MPTLSCMMEDGCRFCFTCLPMALNAMSILSDFTPPVVEPEHPHWNTAYMSRILAKTGHPALSAVANPEVERKLATWKVASNAASPQLSYVPEILRDSVTSTERRNRVPRKNFTTGCLNVFSERVAKIAKSRPKWMDDSVMKTMMIMSIAAESKYAMEEFFVLKPPVATVLKEWLTASKKDMPASIRSSVSVTARATYTNAMTWTVLMERKR